MISEYPLLYVLIFYIKFFFFFATFPHVLLVWGRMEADLLENANCDSAMNEIAVAMRKSFIEILLQKRENKIWFQRLCM